MVQARIFLGHCCGIKCLCNDWTMDVSGLNIAKHVWDQKLKIKLLRFSRGVDELYRVALCWWLQIDGSYSHTANMNMSVFLAIQSNNSQPKFHSVRLTQFLKMYLLQNKSTSKNGIYQQPQYLNSCGSKIISAKKNHWFVSLQTGNMDVCVSEDKVGWLVHPWPLLICLFIICCSPAWLDCRPPATSASLVWSFRFDFLTQCPISAFLPQVTAPWCTRSPWETGWMSQWHQRCKISSLFLRLVGGKEKKTLYLIPP